jgi:hypothetical protein
MSCKAWTRVLVAALAGLVALLCVPSTGFAASRSVELLAPGHGYGSPQGSQPVRDVQRLLLRLGDRPGPVDGLYGPLTTAAVRRFQEAHGLMVDGVVGPQTTGRLTAERTEQRKATADPERESPARSTRAESVPEQPRDRSPANAQPDRASPESSTWRSRWPAAVVGGTALVLLLVVLARLARGRRPRPRGQHASGPRLGLVCAALLAAYVIGAATGAIFASHATPDRGARPSAATAEPRTR